MRAITRLRKRLRGTRAVRTAVIERFCPASHIRMYHKAAFMNGALAATRNSITRQTKYTHIETQTKYRHGETQRCSRTRTNALTRIRLFKFSACSACTYQLGASTLHSCYNILCVLSHGVAYVAHICPCVLFFVFRSLVALIFTPKEFGSSKHVHCTSWIRTGTSTCGSARMRHGSCIRVGSASVSSCSCGRSSMAGRAAAASWGSRGFASWNAHSAFGACSRMARCSTFVNGASSRRSFTNGLGSVSSRCDAEGSP